MIPCGRGVELRPPVTLALVKPPLFDKLCCRGRSAFPRGVCYDTMPVLLAAVRTGSYEIVLWRLQHASCIIHLYTLCLHQWEYLT